MKEDDKGSNDEKNKNLSNSTSSRRELADLFSGRADEKAKSANEIKEAKEKQLFELNSGERTSIFDQQEKIRKMIEDEVQDYDPRFTQYFLAWGKLMNWEEETYKAYRKPDPTAKVITAVIYDRFPKYIRDHIYEKNPYIKWLKRSNKLYKYLGEDGILILERFIDDAISVMQQSENLYDFRVKHALKFGSGFQPELFDSYID